MAAPSERIRDLVSDVTKIGMYSPETSEAEWLEGVNGPAFGARSCGHVKRNGQGPDGLEDLHRARQVPGRELAFGVGSSDEPLSVGRYQLEPTGDGTDVTESFELTKTAMLRLYEALPGWARARTSRNGVRTTLERIKVEVESRRRTRDRRCHPILALGPPEDPRVGTDQSWRARPLPVGHEVDGAAWCQCPRAG